MSILAIVLVLVAFVLVALFMLGLCYVAGRADDQSDECYRNIMAAKDSEQLLDETTTEAGPRVKGTRQGLRIVT